MAAALLRGPAHSNSVADAKVIERCVSLLVTATEAALEEKVATRREASKAVMQTATTSSGKIKPVAVTARR